MHNLKLTIEHIFFKKNNLSKELIYANECDFVTEDVIEYNADNREERHLI